MMRAALDYAGRGWPVMPTWWAEEGKCGCGNPLCPSPAKHPIGALAPNGVKNATVDMGVVRDWWSAFPLANVATACGKGSGFTVVDLDLKGEEDGEWNLDAWAAGSDIELPQTLTAETGSGGRHLFFQYVEGVKNLNPWLPGVDVRNDAGYVLLAPSSHISGGVYRWLSAQGVDTPVEEMPAGMAVALKSAKSARRKGGGTGGAGAAPAYDYREAVRSGPPAGARDAFFNARAYELRMSDWRYEDALADLRRLWELTPQPADRTTFGWEDALGKLDRVWREVTPEPLPEGDVVALETRRARASVDPPKTAPDILATDWGNGQRLVQLFGDRMRYSPTHGWFIWDGTCWAPDELGRIYVGAAKAARVMLQDALTMDVRTEVDHENRQKAIKWAMGTENRARQEAMVHAATKMPEVAIRIEAMDRDPLLLSVPNGTVELDTGRLREHRLDDYITMQSPVQYNPEARSAALDRYLESVTGGDAELIGYLQRAAGYTLTALTEEEVFFILYGPKASGKSTFVDALSMVLGPMAMLTQAETLTSSKRQGNSTPRDELASMLGKRMVSTIEIPDGSRMAESLVKQMTGGDKLSGRHLYKDRFEFHPTFKLWIATNHAPRVLDDAIWRRIKRVPFPRTVPPGERDLTLKRAAKSVASEFVQAMLAWAVAGCVEWRKTGLGTCAAVEQDTANYEDEQDRFGHFVEEELRMDERAQTPSKLLYERYQAWAEEQGERFPLTLTSFSMKLGQIEGVVLMRNARPRGFRGIGLKERSLYGLPLQPNGVSSN